MVVGHPFPLRDPAHAANRVDDQWMPHHPQQFDIAGTIAVGKRVGQVNTESRVVARSTPVCRGHREGAHRRGR